MIAGQIRTKVFDARARDTSGLFNFKLSMKRRRLCMSADLLLGPEMAILAENKVLRPVTKMGILRPRDLQKKGL